MQSATHRDIPRISQHTARLWMGTPGLLAVLAWSLGLVFLTKPPQMFLAAGAALVLHAVLNPDGFRASDIRRLGSRGLLRPSVLVLLLFLVLSPLVVPGQEGSGASWTEGLLKGAGMALRAIVILSALACLTGRVSISEIAGVLERFKLNGLGFSLGVAVNLLPALEQSAQVTARSLWMRGGLRRNRWRSLKLLVVTVLSNALKRAEEIALAAEARAFSPEVARVLPLRVGTLDWFLIVFGLFSLGLLVLLR